MDFQNQGNAFGVIRDGEEVNLPLGQLVVKQLNNDLETLDEREFGAAFSILSTLPPHDNIAPYTGYCCYDEPNDQQVRLVFCRRQGIRLNELLHNIGWAAHFTIIQGITLGLHFLHERPNDPIYHLDLRPCNIFLEVDMQPKLAFFGQSRLFAPDQNLNVNGNIPQPFGYIAPEYHNHGLITDRSDVFGLGILMLEILTGHQLLNNDDALVIQAEVALIRENWSNVQPIQLRYQLINEANILDVMGCIAIAIECLEIDHNIRPGAGQIIDMLHARRPWLDDNLMKYCITQFSNPPGNIGYILSARALLLYSDPNEWVWQATPGGGGIARFPERAEHPGATLRISGEIATKHLMLRTRYSVLLVYALAPNHSGLIDGDHRSEIQSVPFPHVNFQASQERGVRLFGAPPLDGAPEPDVMSYPVDRGDGTIEVELGWFHIIGPVENGQQAGPNTVIAKLSIMSAGGEPVRGLIVEGMEFRPLNFVDPN